MDDVEIDSARQPLGLKKTVGSAATLAFGCGAAQIGFEDYRHGRRILPVLALFLARTRLFAMAIGVLRQSDFAEASSPSYKLTGWPGMIVEIACL